MKRSPIVYGIEEDPAVMLIEAAKTKVTAT